MNVLPIDWGEDDKAKKVVAFALVILAIEALLMGVFISWWLVPVAVASVVLVIISSVRRVP